MSGIGQGVVRVVCSAERVRVAFSAREFAKESQDEALAARATKSLAIELRAIRDALAQPDVAALMEVQS